MKKPFDCGLLKLNDYFVDCRCVSQISHPNSTSLLKKGKFCLR